MDTISILCACFFAASFLISAVLTVNTFKNISATLRNHYPLTIHQKLRICLVVSNTLLQIAFLSFYAAFLAGHFSDLDLNGIDTFVHLFRNSTLDATLFFNFAVTLERYLSFTKSSRNGAKYLSLMALTAFAGVLAVSAAALTSLSSTQFQLLWSIGVDLAALLALITVGGDFAFNLGKFYKHEKYLQWKFINKFVFLPQP